MTETSTTHGGLSPLPGYLCLLAGLTSIVFFLSPWFAIPAAAIALALAKAGFTPGTGANPGQRRPYGAGAIAAAVGLLMTAMPHIPLAIVAGLQGGG